MKAAHRSVPFGLDFLGVHGRIRADCFFRGRGRFPSILGKGDLAVRKIFSLLTRNSGWIPWGREFKGGVLTALSLLASLLVVPELWARTGVPLIGAYTAAVFAAALVTFALAFAVRQPIAAAPAVGINVWLVYGVVYRMGVPWQAVMAAVFCAALLLLLSVVTPLHRFFLSAVPPCIREAARGGLGLLVVFWGLQMGKLVVGSPTTVTMLGSFSEPAVFFALLGLAVALALWAMGIQGAAFWAAALAGAAALAEGFLVLPEAPFILPEGLDRTVFSLDFAAMNQLLGVVLALWLVLFFETFGVLAAFGHGAEKPCELPGKRPFLVLALGNALAALLGTGPLALAKESAAGIAVGARKGAAAMVTALFLLLFVFMEPVAAALLDFPSVIAPALIFSGVSLLQGVQLHWHEPSEVAAFFAVLLVTPLSFSVTAGLGAGVIAYVFLEAFSGRGRKLPPATLLLAVFFVLHFAYVTL